MKITETERTSARIVLELVKSKIDDSNTSEFRLDVYNNGRERGYVLILNYVDNIFEFDKSFWVAFSEYRSSDSTVVYTDNTYWDNEITEKSYQNAEFFKYQNFIKAADYIVDLMEQAVKEVRLHREEVRLAKQEVQ